MLLISTGFFYGLLPLTTSLAEEIEINLEIQHRKLTSPENTFRLTQGDHVTLNWLADEKVDLHLHGYDLKAQVTAADPKTMTFTAHTAGRFPISAHNFDHSTLLYLEIYPD